MTTIGDKNECITLVLLYNSKTSTIPVDSFVDGTATGMTSGYKTREPVKDEVEVIVQMQVAIHLFLDSLQVTWGTLLQRNACGILSLTGGERMCRDH
jgi:hypothetical protein